MRLANPIYDVVFKYLMKDKEIARLLLSRIIDENIIEIFVRPKEYSIKLVKHGITLYRLDFKATIKLKNGGYKTVLIELQKAKHEDDLMRFRRYLGENYRKKDEIIGTNGKTKKAALPIITIYFLGFPMPPIETSIIKVNRIYKDLITNKELTVRTEFIEKLTHDSYVILIPKLPPKERTDLERVLKVFNQSYALDSDQKLLEIANDELGGDDLLAMLANRLRKAATDEEILMGMEVEEEVENLIDKHVRKIDTQLVEIDRLTKVEERLSSEKEENVKENEKLRDEVEELKKQLEKLKNNNN